MTLPSAVIDLKPWKLTLPLGAKGKPTELSGPTLATYDGDYFHVTVDGGVAFRAPVNGVTTSGSSYPRSELRELNADGSLAAWSSSKGAHRVTAVEAFTSTPLVKPHVVGLQIHDGSNDISVFRLEGSNLYVTNGNDSHYKLVTGSYVLGTKYEARFDVYGDVVTAFYNGTAVASIKAKFSNAFFKNGCYTQANCSNSTPCSSANYGEVTVFSVKVEHTAAPVPVTPVPPVVTPPAPTPVPTPVPTPIPVPAAQPMIFVQRHGEKDDNADGVDDVLHGLSAKGRARALAIRDRGLFITPRADLAVPTYILASQGGRMEQTAKPTADVLKLPIDVSLDVETAIDAAAKLLVAKAKAGFVVWAVVEHKGIPKLLKATAKLLGCTDKLPSSHADADFHTGYAFRGAKFSTWQESVLPGDPGYVAVPPVVTPPPVTPPPVVTPPPAPQFPSAEWWARYAPKGSAVYAAILAAVAAVLVTFGVACGADCLPSSGPVTPPAPTSTPAPTPVPTSTPVPTATPTSTVTPVPPVTGRTYPVHSGIVSTTFWVGELFNATAADGSQVCSTYDSQWALHWSGGVKTGVAGSGTDCAGSPTGGCDGIPGTNKCDTEARHPENGFFPTHSNVTPRENPFYLDLPFDDINDATAFKTRCQVIPWANDPGYKGHCTDTNFSYMKNRWVRITGPSGAVCYGQVEDAGPGTYHDTAYVFGANNAKPANKQYNSAGLDVAPALNGCLKFAELDGENDLVSWSFVDAPPAGPWTRVVTTSGVAP